MKKPYIDYDEFELVCWDTDGNGTNVNKKCRDQPKTNNSKIAVLQKKHCKQFYVGYKKNKYLQPKMCDCKAHFKR